MRDIEKMPRKELNAHARLLEAEQREYAQEVQQLKQRITELAAYSDKLREALEVAHDFVYIFYKTGNREVFLEKYARILPNGVSINAISEYLAQALALPMPAAVAEYKALREENARLKEALGFFSQCVYSIDQATVPRGRSPEEFPSQVVVNMSVSLARILKMREALAPPTSQQEGV